ncbi:MAG: BatA domain-containing protein [Gemmatimonadaceae bacterium]
MIWQNIWAITGLSLLALPLLIHLLSRKRAVRHKFPSLRFLTVTRLLPTRSPTLSDIPLLLVRLAIVTAAVMAVAQPLWISQSRKRTLNASLARVLVVDTSLSMHRTMADGKTAVDSARALAVSLATAASASVILQTSSPSDVLAGAAAWLAVQGGRGEVLVLSDFQTGAIDSAAFARVPQRYGVRAIRVGNVPASNSAISLRTARSNVTAVADSGRISAEWTAVNDVESPVALLFAPTDRRDVEAARDAANIVTSPAIADSSKHVAIVFPGATETRSALQGATAPAVEWMAAAMMRVRENELLWSSVANAAVTDTVIAAPFAVIARNQGGAPVVYAAQSTLNGTTRLTFFQRSRTTALGSAALFAAVSSSIALSSGLSESESTVLSEEALRQLEREPQAVAAGVPDSEQRASARSGMSDGRWLWVLVLTLLGVETWLRRKTQDSDILEAA